MKITHSEQTVNNERRPPVNAKRIYRWSDLPKAIELQTYHVTDEGKEPREVAILCSEE